MREEKEVPARGREAVVFHGGAMTKMSRRGGRKKGRGKSNQGERKKFLRRRETNCIQFLEGKVDSHSG